MLQTIKVIVVTAIMLVIGGATAQEKKDKPEVGPIVRGTISSVDADKNTIIVHVAQPDKKPSEKQTFTTSKEVKVTLDESFTKDKAPPAGKLTDLSPGTIVALQLSADKKSVIAIHGRGPSLNGSVKSVDADKNTITLTHKGEGGAQEKTVTVAREAKITMSDGLTKEEKPKEAKLSDLKEGTPVGVQLSVDQKTILGVQVRGGTLQGTLKGVDVGNNTITVTVKEEAQVVDRTLTLVKNARVDGGKLSDLKEGQRVAVILSVFDKAQAAHVRVVGDK